MDSAAERHPLLTPNSHLVNEGVEETPPQQQHQAPGGADPDPGQKQKQKQKPKPGREGQADLFVDLGDANVGFRNWRPVAVTGRGDRLAGQAEMGGVWEWTSSVLRPHGGFLPMKLYPGYTGESPYCFLPPSFSPPNQLAFVGESPYMGTRHPGWAGPLTYVGNDM